MNVQHPAPNRRIALAKAMEDAAIDTDALAKRIAAMPASADVREHAMRVGDAARVLCAAARALHGCNTPALAMFFDKHEQVSAEPSSG